MSELLAASTFRNLDGNMSARLIFGLSDTFHPYSPFFPFISVLIVLRLFSGIKDKKLAFACNIQFCVTGINGFVLTQA